MYYHKKLELKFRGYGKTTVAILIKVTNKKKFKMIFKIFLFILYVGISFPIFNKVHQTSKLVIDEEFHLRQGEHYCKGEFEIVNWIFFLYFYMLHY